MPAVEAIPRPPPFLGEEAGDENDFLGFEESNAFKEQLKKSLFELLNEGFETTGLNEGEDEGVGGECGADGVIDQKELNASINDLHSSITSFRDLVESDRAFTAKECTELQKEVVRLKQLRQNIAQTQKYQPDFAGHPLSPHSPRVEHGRTKVLDLSNIRRGTNKPNLAQVLEGALYEGWKRDELGDALARRGREYLDQKKGMAKALRERSNSPPKRSALTSPSRPRRSNSPSKRSERGERCHSLSKTPTRGGRTGMDSRLSSSPVRDSTSKRGRRVLESPGGTRTPRKKKDSGKEGVAVLDLKKYRQDKCRNDKGDVSPSKSRALRDKLNCELSARVMSPERSRDDKGGSYHVRRPMKKRDGSPSKARRHSLNDVEFSIPETPPKTPRREDNGRGNKKTKEKRDSSLSKKRSNSPLKSGTRRDSDTSTPSSPRKSSSEGTKKKRDSSLSKRRPGSPLKPGSSRGSETSSPNSPRKSPSGVDGGNGSLHRRSKSPSKSSTSREIDHPSLSRRTSSGADRGNSSHRRSKSPSKPNSKRSKSPSKRSASDPPSSSRRSSLGGNDSKLSASDLPSFSRRSSSGANDSRLSACDIPSSSRRSSLGGNDSRLSACEPPSLSRRASSDGNGGSKIRSKSPQKSSACEPPSLSRRASSGGNDGSKRRSKSPSKSGACDPPSLSRRSSSGVDGRSHKRSKSPSKSGACEPPSLSRKSSSGVDGGNCKRSKSPCKSGACEPPSLSRRSSSGVDGDKRKRSKSPSKSSTPRGHTSPTKTGTRAKSPAKSRPNSPSKSRGSDDVGHHSSSRLSCSTPQPRSRSPTRRAERPRSLSPRCERSPSIETQGVRTPLKREMPLSPRRAKAMIEESHEGSSSQSDPFDSPTAASPGGKELPHPPLSAVPLLTPSRKKKDLHLMSLGRNAGRMKNDALVVRTCPTSKMKMQPSLRATLQMSDKVKADGLLDSSTHTTESKNLRMVPSLRSSLQKDEIGASYRDLLNSTLHTSGSNYTVETSRSLLSDPCGGALQSKQRPMKRSSAYRENRDRMKRDKV